MTVAPLLETLELPIPDPRFQPLLSSLTSDRSPLTALAARARLWGICSVLVVLAGFFVSLNVLA
jgi:hypothetical protein